MKQLTIPVLILLGVLLISCDLSKQISSYSVTDTNTTDLEVSKTISTSEGGELILPDKTVLRIYPGSFQTNTQVSLSKSGAHDLPTTPEELSTVGGVYDIKIGTAILEKPATLEIPFDPKLLPNRTKPSQVFLAYYDEIKSHYQIVSMLS